MAKPVTPATPPSSEPSTQQPISAIASPVTTSTAEEPVPLVIPYASPAMQQIPASPAKPI